VRIGILGPLEVRDQAGQPVRLGGPRLRALLIRLALDPRRTIAAERLAADLWPDTGPADASNALQALVSRLRNAAGPDIIEHWPGGCQLALDSAAVDAGQFEQLVATGRGGRGAGDPERGAAVLRQALTPWRGPALVDVEDAPLVGAGVGPGTCTGGRNPTRNRRLDPILGKCERQHGYDHRG
jgi:DNA-binding SARP family transcriptional activator